MELVKTQMQTQSGTTGPLDCIKKIRSQAGFRGLTRGLFLTASREVPGFATYFASYEVMVRSVGILLDYINTSITSILHRLKQLYV